MLSKSSLDHKWSSFGAACIKARAGPAAVSVNRCSRAFSSSRLISTGRLRATRFICFALVEAAYVSRPSRCSAAGAPLLPQPGSHIIIHAGPHKTGSTYVQTWLLDSRDVLHANGWTSLTDSVKALSWNSRFLGLKLIYRTIRASGSKRRQLPSHWRRAILASECFDRDGSDWKSRRAKNHGKADGFLRAFRQRLDLYARFIEQSRTARGLYDVIASMRGCFNEGPYSTDALRKAPQSSAEHAAIEQMGERIETRRVEQADALSPFVTTCQQFLEDLQL